MRTTKEGVPVLSAEEIDAYAERLVKKIQPELFSGGIDHTDLKKLFSLLPGWHYGGVYLSGRPARVVLLGLCIFQGGDVRVFDENGLPMGTVTAADHTILINRRLVQKANERVFRFTFCHEAGHALLHEKFCSDPENMKQYADDEKKHFFGDDADRLQMNDRQRLKTPRDFVEWQANAFAGAVLMPRTLVLKVRDLVYEKDESLQVNANELLTALTDVFLVSRSAAFYRMKGLRLVEESAAFQENGLIRTS